MTIPTFALKQYCSNWKASGLNIHVSDPNKPFSKKRKIRTSLNFLGGTGVNQAVPGRRSLVSVSITKLPGRLKSSRKSRFGNRNTFFSFYLPVIEKKIHINDRYVLPLKAFELTRKTHVGSRIDSFNFTHFHLACEIRGMYFKEREEGGWESRIQSLNPLKTPS